ncbi:hypothetical protein PS928_05612 [Pseudomonas fluorescens]|uniref:Transmembrane protein n=1 Tax=Pseudomonas fluorescens TaxID=294 RepID=A0A5E7VM09_PSEFL|nr:hypothetical protein PS928_05612 [Pseudomonas fluorescens]
MLYPWMPKTIRPITTTATHVVMSPTKNQINSVLFMAPVLVAVASFALCELASRRWITTRWVTITSTFICPRHDYIHWPLRTIEIADSKGSYGLHFFHNGVFAVDLRGTCSFKFLRAAIIFMS